MPSKKHWEEVYATKAPDSVSWYQVHAGQSLELIESTLPGPDAQVIDVGGGASRLVDALVARGGLRLSVLDISGAALALTRARLGDAAHGVTWLEGDITTAALPRRAYDIWHDRAVFHFLTHEEDRRAYVAQAKNALKPGGNLIVATFALDGPEKCSGLPIVRYSPETLAQAFGGEFAPVQQVREAHVTPWGSVQHFVYGRFVYAPAQR